MVLGSCFGAIQLPLCQFPQINTEIKFKGNDLFEVDSRMPKTYLHQLHFSPGIYPRKWLNLVNSALLLYRWSTKLQIRIPIPRARMKCHF